MLDEQISVIVQEVYAGGMADKDGRLAAGDYLLEVIVCISICVTAFL